MDKDKKLDALTPDVPDTQKVEEGIPVESAADAIENAAPTAAFVEHEPADVAPEELGEEKLGPANHYAALEDGMNAKTGDPSKPQPPKKPRGEFVEKVWRPFLWPVVTLTVICLVASLLLGITNSITKPIIDANTAGAAGETRKELLPAANGFEEVALSEVPAGITSMYRATNDVGYVIEAYAAGYGGDVPVMVAFDMAGVIQGVRFLENSETPGLGQKVNTEEWFSEQFEGKQGNIPGTGIDKIASATISSNAGLSAVNAAVALFDTEVLGNASGAVSGDDLHAMLLPDAGTINPVSVSIPDVQEAYVGDDGGVIVYGVSKGIYGDDIIAAVGIDAGGTITGIWLDTSHETAGFGLELNGDEAFKGQFIGKTDTGGVEPLTGVTISTAAVIEAVQTALNAQDTVRGAA